MVVKTYSITSLATRSDHLEPYCICSHYLRQNIRSFSVSIYLDKRSGNKAGK